VTKRIPEIVDVPAAVIVKVPVIEGVFEDPAAQLTIFTPGVIVTFSVTEVLKKIVSPALAAAIAAARVV
jgi:hypothetical protein